MSTFFESYTQQSDLIKLTKNRETVQYTRFFDQGRIWKMIMDLTKIFKKMGVNRAIFGGGGTGG